MPYKSIPSGADWFIVGHRVETNVDGEEITMGARTQWKQQLGIGVIVDF